MKQKRKVISVMVSLLLVVSCSGNKAQVQQAVDQTQTTLHPVVEFNADSAYTYVDRQVKFGPRVPNTEAHRRCGEYLAEELKRRGAQVHVQEMQLKAFDGTLLNARNIMGMYNLEASDRLLLLAHWDSRPWADADPDEANHTRPVDGANDGASGVGVLLEMARLFSIKNPGRGVDILFLDAEDWGDHDNEDSWALGADYFVKNPIIDGYKPTQVILLDMVGGENARFAREYYSQKGAAALVNQFWSLAALSGYGEFFPDIMGGGVVDDHVKFLEVGIPAIDIIEYNSTSGTGFNPRWHTVNDTMEGISTATLKAVGQTLTNYVYQPNK